MNVKTSSGGCIVDESHLLRCAMHTLQLGVKSAVEWFEPVLGNLRSLLSTIRVSKVRRDIFRSICRSMSNVEREPPCTDCPTRFNSTHIMIQQCLALRPALDVIALHERCAGDLDQFRRTNAQWVQIQHVSSFLDLPARLSTFLGGDNYPTISVAVRVNEKMISHCRDVLASCARDSMLREAIPSALEYHRKYDEYLNSDVALIAMFLDPRNAKPEGVDLVKCRLRIVEVPLLSYNASSDGEDPHDVRHSAPDDDLWNDSGHSADTLSLDGIDKELSSYIAAVNENVQLRQTDIIRWWQYHRSKYRRLYPIAVDYLAIPATSIANSTARRIFDDRETLSNAMFKAEICVSSWMGLFDRLGVTIPGDVNQAFRHLQSTISSAELRELASSDPVVQLLVDELDYDTSS
ncbi:hypothetical protein PBRA_009593 [Plasmodiophora brassicae]|uniref:HAT C-terminal dimerisation domain-containing protein n=1 Tax=Plasmodiophora brassicae TaxID=37360 RepID=A0A0G4IIN7_PLABS|nr:hypothetical protein PBRA_009593 [Plasmodiophora brassicae]